MLRTKRVLDVLSSRGLPLSYVPQPLTAVGSTSWTHPPPLSASAGTVAVEPTSGEGSNQTGVAASSNANIPTPWKSVADAAYPMPFGVPNAATVQETPSSTFGSMTIDVPGLHDLTPPVSSERPLDFQDSVQALEAKSTVEIMRSLAILRACRLRWLVRHADTVLAWSKAMLGSPIVNGIIKRSFYRQFVGGADADELRPLLSMLSSHGIGAVLDYAAEDDVHEDGEMPASRQPPTDTVVARTYKYEDEAVCDRRLEVFLKSIDAAQRATPAGQQGFAAIKVTALGPPALLERVSTALVAVQDLFRSFDEDGDGTVSADEFARVHHRLFREHRPVSEGLEGADASDPFSYDWLDTDRDGRVDYVAFTKRVTLADAAHIASRLRQQGPFSEAALSSEELELLDAMTHRVDVLAEAAAERGVRLLIDAEHSYFQPAIDAIVAYLQRKYNKTDALVYGTYQCYLKDVHERIAVDLERARRDGYYFGAKLVRGAYMELERKRAADMGEPSPIWDTIEDTHAAYDGAVTALLPVVRDEGAEIMVATHNQRYVGTINRSGIYWNSFE